VPLPALAEGGISLLLRFARLTDGRDSRSEGSLMDTQSGRAFIRAFRFSLAAAVLLLPGLGSDAMAQLPRPVPAHAVSPARAQVPAGTAGGGFVGSEMCVMCHDSEGASLSRTPHGRAADPRSPAARQSCEGCHGPGKAHVDAGGGIGVGGIVNPGKLSPQQASATCTTCHNRGEHALWEGSQHDSRAVSCTTCHSVHDYKSETKQLKEKTQAQVCASCHRDKIAKLDRSGHMPVREGKIECATCHNVHGSTNVRLLRKGDSIAEACTSCHAEKRGPFLWEHASTRDGCVTCHDPHGSSNERMLVAKPPILCQRCHVATRHPSTIYDAAVVGAGANPSIRIFARSCVTCHSAIHGSNHPSGQRFVR
jgi:DmsE family decaheme c-type cytochrome